MNNDLCDFVCSRTPLELFLELTKRECIDQEKEICSPLWDNIIRNRLDSSVHCLRRDEGLASDDSRYCRKRNGGSACSIKKTKTKKPKREKGR